MGEFLHSANLSFFPKKVVLVSLVLFGFRLVLLTALEKRDPAHFVPYRMVLPRDILAMLVFAFGVVPAADFIDRWIMYP